MATTLQPTTLLGRALRGRGRGLVIATLVALVPVLLLASGRRAGRARLARGAGEERVAPPARLADTGLYADFGARRVAADNLPYAPQYPLFTDGAHKRRWIHVPPGTAIDASDVDRWRFPVGTRLWKEFAFDRPVETRYLERLPDGSWLHATYVWAVDGSDAVLAPEAGVRGAYVLPGGLAYDVPARTDCVACHGGRSAHVLGFDALQLSPDRDPLAPHADPGAPNDLDLPALVARGLLVGLDPSFLATPPRVPSPTPRERAALGYLHGNCAACHNPEAGVDGLGLDLSVRLRPGDDVLPSAIATALGVGGRFRPASGSDDFARLVSGHPERSTVALRAAARDALTRMPPLGRRLVDEEATHLLDAWIREDLAAHASSLDPNTPLRGTKE